MTGLRVVLGEDTAKLVGYQAVAFKECTVVMIDPAGVRRSVQVTAETLFEAAAIALHAFKNDGFTDFVANVFEIEIREPSVKHQVSIGQVRQWLGASVSDPRERLRREKLKRLVS